MFTNTHTHKHTHCTVRGVSKDIVRASSCWVKDPALLAMMVRWTLGEVYLRNKKRNNFAGHDDSIIPSEVCVRK